MVVFRCRAVLCEVYVGVSVAVVFPAVAICIVVVVGVVTSGVAIVVGTVIVAGGREVVAAG